MFWWISFHSFQKIYHKTSDTEYTITRTCLQNCKNIKDEKGYTQCCYNDFCNGSPSNRIAGNFLLLFLGISLVNYLSWEWMRWLVISYQDNWTHAWCFLREIFTSRSGDLLRLPRALCNHIYLSASMRIFVTSCCTFIQGASLLLLLSTLLWWRTDKRHHPLPARSF